jgi:hypothetical protein
MLAVIGAVAVLAAFYMLVLKPERAELARLDAEIAKQETRRDTAQQRVADGERARKRYAEDYETIVRVGRAVPVDDQVPSLVFGLESTGKRHDVNLRKLKLKVNTAPAAPAPAAAPAPSGGKAAVPATQTAAATAPPGSAVGSAGFPTLPFEFEFESDFFKFERFLADVEKYSSTIASGKDVDVRGRLVTVDGVGLQASGLKGFPRVKATIAATTYVDPEGARALSSATPAGPTAGAAGTTATGAPGAPAAPTSSTTTATVRGVTP